MTPSRSRQFITGLHRDKDLQPNKNQTSQSFEFTSHVCFLECEEAKEPVENLCRHRQNIQSSPKGFQGPR